MVPLPIKQSAIDSSMKNFRQQQPLAQNIPLEVFDMLTDLMLRLGNHQMKVYSSRENHRECGFILQRMLPSASSDGLQWPSFANPTTTAQ